jgi:hypothetical protein
MNVIIAMIFKERHIKHSPLMVQVAHLLMTFMRPSEVYHVLIELFNSSNEAFKNESDKNLIRWHFTFEKHQYFKLLNTFIKSYIRTTVRGKRSLLKHMTKIGFDFTKFVDFCFKSLLTYFLSLPIALDILMMFLNEGVKILFRFTYAIMKCHKHFIKKCTSAPELMEYLQKEARLNTSPSILTKKAFAYPLKRGNYNFSKASTDTGKPSGDDEEDYMPNVPTNSKILEYEDFAKIWKMLPDYVKIRVPELIFCT